MNKAGILVTGATGTIGTALLAELAERRVRARVLVRDKAASSAIAANGFELAEGDFSKPASLAAAMDGAAHLFLLTPVHQHADAWFDTALKTARSAGVRHIVRLSAMGASETAGSELLQQHWRCDEALKQSGISWTILRPSGFFQNMLWQAAPICAEGRFYLPLGTGRYGYLDARDIAAAAATVLSEGGHEACLHELTGPEALTCTEMATILSEVTRREVTYVAIPPEVAEQSLRGFGLPEWDARAITSLQAWMAEGHGAKLTGDVEQLTGQKPRRFQDFVRDHARAFGGS